MRRASVLGSKSRITSCVATVGYVTGNVDELALLVARWTRFGWCIGLQCVSTLRAFPGILHAFTSSFFILIIESFRPILARIFHESLAATMDIAVLPGVLGCRPLLRTVQVRLGPIPRYRWTVARWHAHLHGLATAIHEISGLGSGKLAAQD